MLIIDTIDIYGEGYVDFKTKISAEAIIQCYKLGIPCFVKTEYTSSGATYTSLVPLEIVLSGDTQWQMHFVTGDAPYTAMIEDLSAPATFALD